jgi:hypothetical protein
MGQAHDQLGRAASRTFRLGQSTGAPAIPIWRVLRRERVDAHPSQCHFSKGPAQ